jgi:hypothetical protein
MPITEKGTQGDFDGTPTEVTVLTGTAAGPRTLIGFSAVNRSKSGTQETIEHQVLLRKKASGLYYDLASGPMAKDGGVWAQPVPFTTVMNGESIVVTLGEATITALPTWTATYLERTA